MSNQFLPKCAPIWGFPAHMTIADFAPTKQEATLVLENVSEDTVSEEISLGARGVALNVDFEDRTATCDIALGIVNGPDLDPVKAWTGVKYSHTLYAGNLEMVDLAGRAFKITVSNVSAGFVNVSVKVTY